jgi:hypothetical protein
MIKYEFLEITEGVVKSLGLMNMNGIKNVFCILLVLAHEVA